MAQIEFMLWFLGQKQSDQIKEYEAKRVVTCKKKVTNTAEIANEFAEIVWFNFSL